MPYSPKKPCGYSMCAALVEHGTRYCERHQAADRRRGREQDRARGSAAMRGYDRLWQRFRLVVLSERPLCEDCRSAGRRLTPATEVHHVRALRDGGARLDPENVRALCKACHSKRTAVGE
jgi:5-methylcytosine-specific restriction protein A